MLRIAILISLLLAGCATQVDTRYTRKAVEERVAAWNNLAREYIKAGKFEDAKRPLKRALEIDDKSGESLALLAFVFQSQNENDIADRYYREALKAAPDDPSTNNNYGIFLMLQRRYSEACGYLARAAEEPLYVLRTQALENLAACYAAKGDAAMAEETYRRVLRLNPDAAGALVALADMALARGDSGEAWSLFQRFSDLVRNRRAAHTAKSLWLGIRLARLAEDASLAATYALLLKSSFPDSEEYKKYKESRR